MSTPSNPQVPTRHSLPTDILQKVLNYLTTKAFSEVHSLIQEIQAHASQVIEPILVCDKVEPLVQPSSSDDKKS